MRALVVAVLVATACRGGGRTHAAAKPIVLPSIEARPHGQGDPIVAKVDGRNIYGSCVAAQAAALHEDRRRALDDCIGFELLAGAAAARGKASDPDVIDGYRRALVGRFVDVEFRDHYQRAADLPVALLDPTFERFKWRMHRPEYRFAVYVRAAVDDKATPADEAAAHALIVEIYDQVKDRHDLFPADLFAIAASVAHGRKLETLPTPYGTSATGPGHPSFTKPLFEIPAIGSVSPPSRTQWGWDLILWTDTLPPLETSKDELEAWLFPQLRRSLFGDWIDGLARAANTDIFVDEDRLAALAPRDDAPDPQAPPPPPPARKPGGS